MTCAIYCRLSKEDENSVQESESIQNQKNLLINHAVQQEWDIYNIYCDDDYSGADQDRPEWNDMLRAAQAGKFQIVLCKTQSRFTRDMEMVEKYLHGMFPPWESGSWHFWIMWIRMSRATRRLARSMD